MNDEQLLRYSRHILLPQIDVAGQEKLLNARVLIVGLGGLGCPAAMYLASAGVGHLVLADFDKVDLSNLQRQILHGQGDLGKTKVESARDSLLAMNNTLKVTTLNEKLEGAQLDREVALADVVLDCTDNISTRHQINEVCVRESTPLVSGAAIRMEGQIAVFDSRVEDAPCYRCLYALMGDQNLSCSENGILSPVVGIVGAVQAVEAMKLLAGFGAALVGRLLMLDAMSMEWRTLNLPKRPDCPVCGEHCSEH